MSKKIKNILFDLGGVILDIDFKKPAELFKKMGLQNFETLYSQARQNQLFDKLETGKINETAFLEELQAMFDKKPTINELKSAWNSMIKEFDERKISQIEFLRKKHKIFLLSNTNSIHYQYYNTIFIQEFGYKSLDELFHKAYLSFRIGMRKPDKEIYQFVLKNAGIKAYETVFIDDSEKNLINAEIEGIRTYSYKNNENFVDILDSLND